MKAALMPEHPVVYEVENGGELHFEGSATLPQAYPARKYETLMCS